MEIHSCGVDSCTCVSGLPASFLVLHPVPAVSAVPPLPRLPFPGGAIAHAWLWTVEGTETQLGAYRGISGVITCSGSHVGRPPSSSSSAQQQT